MKNTKYLSPELPPHDYFYAFIEKYKPVLQQKARAIASSAQRGGMGIDYEDAYQELLLLLWSLIIKDKCSRTARDGYCLQAIKRTTARIILKNNRQPEFLNHLSEDKDESSTVEDSTETVLGYKNNGTPVFDSRAYSFERQIFARELLKLIYSHSKQDSALNRRIIIRFLIDPPQEMLNLPDTAGDHLEVGSLQTIANYLGVHPNYIRVVRNQLKNKYGAYI